MIANKTVVTVENLTGAWAEGTIETTITKVGYHLRWVAIPHQQTWLPELIILPLLKDLALLQRVINELGDNIVAAIKVTIKHAA